MTDVIIVSYYTGDILLENIKIVLTLEGLENIILINNGNPVQLEANLQQLSEHDPRIKLISGYGNIGFAAGCNLGASHSKAKFLLFLNPDCIILNNNTLTKLAETLAQHPQYKLITCKILNKDDTTQKTCRRNLLTPLIAITESFNIYKITDKLKPLNLPVNEISDLPEISEVPALSGAVVFTSKKYYEAIGGFDEQYFLHVEDMDLCMRVHLNGDKIAFVKNIAVRHMLSTSQVTNEFLELHKAKGFILYIQKFFPRFRKFPLNLLLQFLIKIRFFIKTNKHCRKFLA